MLKYVTFENVQAKKIKYTYISTSKKLPAKINLMETLFKKLSTVCLLIDENTEGIATHSIYKCVHCEPSEVLVLDFVR